MNAKKSKQLRAIARAAAPSVAPLAYELGLNDHAIVVNPKSERGIYRNLKRAAGGAR